MTADVTVRPRGGLLAGSGRAIYLACVALVFAFLLTPVVFVAWVSFFSNAIITFPPQGYTTRLVPERLGEPRLHRRLPDLDRGRALRHGRGACASASRRPSRSCAAVSPGARRLNALLLSPLIVPGIVAGTAVYVYFVQLEIWTGTRFIATLPGLIAAHVMLTIPWTVRLIAASLTGIDRSVEEAAMNLGASPLTAFLRVTLPMIRPGVVAAAIFGFIASFTDLEMTLFLVGPNRTTLQIALLQYLEWKFDPSVAAVSVVQIVIVAAALLVTDRFVKLSRVV